MPYITAEEFRKYQKLKEKNEVIVSHETIKPLEETIDVNIHTNDTTHHFEFGTPGLNKLNPEELDMMHKSLFQYLRHMFGNKVTMR